MDRGAVRQLEEQLGRDGLAELAGTFLDSSPERLARLRAAVAARDASAVRKAAQALKGTARSFGAAEVGEIAARLEREAATGSLEGGDARIAALALSFERTRTELAQQLTRHEGENRTGRSIRVLLADDNPDVRGVLTALLDTEPSLELIGAAGDADAAIELAAAAHPDVALLDLDMPGGGGWRVVEEIESCCPETQSIVLTAPDTPGDHLHTMRSRPVDFLPKGASRDDILAAIRSAVSQAP